MTREVSLNPYCQVVFETNRYSVPTDHAYPTLTLRAFPFSVVNVSEKRCQNNCSKRNFL